MSQHFLANSVFRLYERISLAKALIVSSAFPPLGSTGGTIRLVKLLKFMSRLDWEFIVFTQDPRRPIVPEVHLSEVLFEDLPENITIYRIPAPFTPNTTSSPSSGRGLEKIITVLYKSIFRDSALPWGLRVFVNSLSCMNKTKVDLVFGTAPPFTNALIAMLLGWATHKPFILDLRDDWVGLPIFRLKNILRQKLEISLESLIVRRASAVITVTPQSYDLYKDRYGSMRQPQKFHMIPNGCDLDEYTNLENRERRIASKRFLILSAAWWYRKDRRDISPFLLALDMFFKRRVDTKNKIDVVLLGDSLSAEYDQQLADLNLVKTIRRLGSVDRNELVEWLWRADLFLLVQPVGNTTAISGTLYEYWATGKAPILLISEEGASSYLVTEHRIGKHFEFNQVDAISHYIEEIYDAYQIEEPVWINRKGINSFDRKELAKRMNEIWINIAFKN
jgi:glycosyltransferase involved in cell wall biosynthesis